MCFFFFIDCVFYYYFFWLCVHKVVWKKGTEKSLGIELIPRKGSGMVGQKDVVRAELQEGALLNSVVTTSYIRDATYVTGGQHLRKGCRLMSVNGDPVARLPFRQVLEHLLVNQRPLVTTWKLYVTPVVAHVGTATLNHWGSRH